ncbi:unnamed protein product [Heligmosomoides polygyrus]|uniref:Chromo domain-containing protein n=1 Tax=Heligmosomoides polygyrus TaxID=6339 RepID=A0A183FGF4_HELPZ|nr:unnamed protein product [Heligmosomoides polygyrus]
MIEEVMGPEKPPPLVDKPANDDEEDDGEGCLDESKIGTIDVYEEEGLYEIRVDVEVEVHDQRVIKWVWPAPAPDGRQDRVGERVAEDEGRQGTNQSRKYMRKWINA